MATWCRVARIHWPVTTGVLYVLLWCSMFLCLSVLKFWHFVFTLFVFMLLVPFITNWVDFCIPSLIIYINMGIINSSFAEKWFWLYQRDLLKNNFMISFPIIWVLLLLWMFLGYRPAHKIQRRLQKPVKRLRWNFSRKYLTSSSCYLLLRKAPFYSFWIHFWNTPL